MPHSTISSQIIGESAKEQASITTLQILQLKLPGSTVPGARNPERQPYRKNKKEWGSELTIGFCRLQVYSQEDFLIVLSREIERKP